jgi:hypothetical protein
VVDGYRDGGVVVDRVVVDWMRVCGSRLIVLLLIVLLFLTGL